jgi:hypothetical protein
MDLDVVRHETVGALERLKWQTEDVVNLLVRPTWGTEKHGYDRLLYGVVMSTMALGDRLSFYRWPDSHQSKRLVALFRDLGADAEAATVTVQMWRHTLMHTGDPITLTNPETGKKYGWLLHWGEEHLPREHHLTLTSQADRMTILNFGAQYAVTDLHRLAERLVTSAEKDADEGERLLAAHQRLARKQKVYIVP